MAEPVRADQSGSQDTSLLVCPRPGFVLPAAASSPRNQNRDGIEDCLNLLSCDLEKKCCWRETSKKKIRALTLSHPKHCFSLNVSNLRWNLSPMEMKVPNSCLSSVGGRGDVCAHQSEGLEDT